MSVDQTAADKDLAASVRAGARALNAAVAAANQAGISVHFGISQNCDKVSATRVTSMRIERPSDLWSGYKGIEL